MAWQRDTTTAQPAEEWSGKEHRTGAGRNQHGENALLPRAARQVQWRMPEGVRRIGARPVREQHLRDGTVS